jgi:predicted nucleic acid-binding protein
MVLVDTSAWIEFLRPQGSTEKTLAVDGLLYEYQVILCGPVKLEVLGNAGRQHRPRMESFFNDLPYQPMTDTAWEQSRVNAWRLRDRGFTVNWMDVLIGTLALEWGCRVYSQDRDFEMMRDELGIVLYEPGIGGKYNPENL